MKVCGKNPGYVVSSTNAMTVTLHADDPGIGSEQKFFMRMSVTKGMVTKKKIVLNLKGLFSKYHLNKKKFKYS